MLTGGQLLTSVQSGCWEYSDEGLPENQEVTAISKCLQFSWDHLLLFELTEQMSQDAVSLLQGQAIREDNGHWLESCHHPPYQDESGPNAPVPLRVG